ncbi:MAG TPA: extracellular solute-binding protein, partial [Acidimicrobiales bacterium]|nr:extracellular solute-binding protein [Acidimicrobiales bacterium]
MSRAMRALAVGAGVVVGAAGCGSATGSSSPTPAAPAASPPSTTAARGSGPVDVLYAGSLVDVMEKRIGPAFHAATGYSLQGFAAGSTALASQIKGKVRQGDVFISASPTVNATLEGPANGGWVSWYATFAVSPLVLGYNPHSRFAHDLKTQPWYRVIAQPGFLLGRTDPATDPKGKLAVTALRTAAQQRSEPALANMAASDSGVYPEETLVGRLQAGQLDAGFFYTSETTAASIPTVPLTGQDLKATYTVTVLQGAPDQAGAEAFVAYLLSPAGRDILVRAGFQMVEPPTVSGSGVP